MKKETKFFKGCQVTLYWGKSAIEVTPYNSLTTEALYELTEYLYQKSTFSHLAFVLKVFDMTFALYKGLVKESSPVIEYFTNEPRFKVSAVTIIDNCMYVELS